MLRFLVPLIFVLSSATSLRNRLSPHKVFPQEQVASESQVKFALESRYDDTGPGAKQPEYAYNTYNNLEDALIGYLDDPDTKLPAHEKAKAIKKITQSQYYTSTKVPNQSSGIHFNRNSNYKLTFGKPNLNPAENYEVFKFPIGKIYYSQETKGAVAGPRGVDDKRLLGQYPNEKKVELFRYRKIHNVPKTLSLAHYTKGPERAEWRGEKEEQSQKEFDSHPSYDVSYGNKNSPGDSKTLQGSPGIDTVHGFYSFIGSDGQTKTVHYTGNDLVGFQTNVQHIRYNQ